MKKYMLDTNIFNRLLDGSIDLNILSDKTCYATHVQHDELRAVKEVQRRLNLEKIFSEVLTEQLPTQSVILDVSRLDEAYLGDGDLYQQVLEALDQRNKAKSNNEQDALIAETALVCGLTLVTEDRHLREVVAEIDGEVCGIVDLL